MFQVLCVNKQSFNKSTFCYHVFLGAKASFKNAEIVNKKTTQHTVFGIEENKFASENSPNLKSENKTFINMVYDKMKLNKKSFKNYFIQSLFHVLNIH